MKDNDINPLLSNSHIKNFYNKHEDCWPEDCFSRNTTKFINKNVNKFLEKMSPSSIILNAGSGDTKYEKAPLYVYNVDIAEKKVCKLSNSYICSIENMPFANSDFDCIICVGTVINYADLVSSIGEFRRVIKKGGFLVLEYERSGTALVDKNVRNMDEIEFLHKYYGEAHANKLYSDTYVNKILKENNFSVLNSVFFNTAIPFIELFASQKTAENLIVLDSFLSHLPYVNKFSHNRFLICQQK